MDEKVYLEKLEKREIKPTAMRLLILKAMTRFTRAFSLLDLETELDTVDKSTIFRTINLFLDHHLIHVIDDGSGSLKYSVCSNECTCSIDDLHAHFYCRNCHKTFCLRKYKLRVEGVMCRMFFTGGIVIKNKKDMKTSKFKTTAKCGGCVAKIGETLDKVVARDQWNIDLSTPDRVLTITSDLSDDRVIELVKEAGFKAEKLE